MAGMIGGSSGGMNAAATAQQQQELDMTSAQTTMANTQTQKEKMWQQVANNKVNMVMEQSQFNAKLGDKINLSH